jgi:hypothetical protein
VTRIAVLLAAVVSAVSAPAAQADTIVREQGAVRATLAASPVPGAFGRYRADNLEIVRGGQTLFDAVPDPRGCESVLCSPLDLRVRDLDGDGEPEVIYRADSGYPQCCVITQVYWLLADGSRYVTIDHDFGRGFVLKQLGSDPGTEFVSSDVAFVQFRVASGNEALPLSIWRYERLRFTDVTRRFPRQLRREAREFWQGYLKVRRDRDGAWVSQVAGWAADRYRLGRRAEALRVLGREADRAYMRGTTLPGRKFIRYIDTYLRQNGYSRP